MKAKDGNATREQAWLYFEKQTVDAETAGVGMDCQFCEHAITRFNEVYYDMYVRPGYSNYVGAVCQLCYDAMKEPSEQ